MNKKKLLHFTFFKAFYFSIFLSIPVVVFPLLSYANQVFISQNNTNDQLADSLAKSLLREINLARTNPIGYADLLENSLLTNTTSPKKEEALVMIDFLRNLKPLPELTLSNDLSKIAAKVVNQNNSSPNNYGIINISIPSEPETKAIIIELFSNKSSQETIFTQAIDSTGVACDSSSQKCVITYPLNGEIITDTNDIDDIATLTNQTETTTDNQDKTNNTEKPQEASDTQEIAATQQYNLLERGVLEDGDTVIPSDNSLYDSYQWKGQKGDSLTITLESDDFDSYLAVQDPQGQIIAENDDFSEGNSNSGLTVVLPEDGVYRLIVNSYDPKGRGNYTISVTKK